jgi:hypothetical protein
MRLLGILKKYLQIERYESGMLGCGCTAAEEELEIQKMTLLAPSG